MIPDGQERGRVILAAAADPQRGDPPTVARNYDWPALASAGLVACVNALVVTGFRLPFLGPAIGFWFLVVLPVYLLCTTSAWRGSS